MREVLVVRNTTNANISFNLYAPIDIDLNTVSDHKRRKLRKLAMVNVVIPPQSSVDLVEKTGIPITAIKGGFEYIHLLGSRLQVMYDSSVEYEDLPERLNPVRLEGC